jgi:NADP-dependent 3-hydroxy acid dehydrogenase YdfG
MSNRNALVTGASAGIGAATVQALVSDGWTVHMTARRGDRLAALAAETGAVAHVIDAGDAVAMAALVGEVPFDLIVANAGKGRAMASIAGVDAAEIEDVIHLNVTSLLQLIAAALPGMQDRARGHIITIGSVAGLYPTGSTLYGASKHAVRGVIRNLRVENIGKGIRFTDIQPGRVATEFYDVAVDDAVQRAVITDTKIEELTPENVAEAIRWVAGQPAHVNISALEIAPTDQAYGGVKFPS